MSSCTATDLQRQNLLRKLYEKRNLLLAMIESYMLRSAGLGDHAATTDASYADSVQRALYDDKEYRLRRDFLMILAQQQQLRRDATSVSPPEHGLARMRTRYTGWSEERLTTLLSLLTDLYRQLQPVLVEQSSAAPDNDAPNDYDHDVRAVAAISVGGGGTYGNFAILSETYTTVFRLL